MDFYKKIFRSKKLRFKILSAMRVLPDQTQLKLQYRIKSGRELNLAKPERYTEKIQWYKLFYRDPLMQQCADKYRVREYIRQKGLEEILNELYAVFRSPEEIDLAALPEKFVLKVSNGSSTNLLCTDKSALDPEAVREQFRDYLLQSASYAGCEWVYEGYEPVIVAEAYLEDKSGGNPALTDYKILCFNGQPTYIICVDGRGTADYRHIIYDTAWTKQDVTVGESSSAGECPRPDTLDRMLEIARILSADFPAVRVDLYTLQGKIYFGELTYFPWSGYMHFQPDSFDFALGRCFALPERNH